MTDLTKLLAEIQVPETTHVDLYKRRGRGSLQWFLEKDVKAHPIHNNNDLQFFVCGQEGFASIEADIRKATSSIDLVLWGFDPGMELSRKGTTWPRGTTYGDLLIAKAREGVKVRMLVWYGGNVVSGVLTENSPDLGLLNGLEGSPSKNVLQARAPAPAGSMSRNWTLTDRSNYCSEWWTQALHDSFPNLKIRLRKMHSVSIALNAQTYLPDSAKSLTEEKGMKHVATHHQKPVLIDYPTSANKGKKLNTCAYVMGLNSVTDYWDTAQHGYNDPLRELSPASGTITESSMWYRKPYRDYAIRVQGEALYDINANFVEGWDNADGYGGAHGAGGARLVDERKDTQAKDIPRPPGSGCRAQIVRTFPDQKEATILKAYTLASSNAVNYIYVENQYFQLAEWSRLLKKIRQQYRTGMSDAGAKPTDIAPLHVFVVIPQPERDEMVPSTYDTLKQLNQTQNMGAYDQQVQGKSKPPEDQGFGASVLKAALNPIGTALGAAKDMAEEAAKKAVAKESADAAPANPAGELNALGIKTLAAMLMTYDGANQAKDIRIKDRDNNAQRAQAKQEEEDNAKPKAKVHGGKANDVDLERLDECTIQPGRYREIYIHSKLMFVDDVYTTLGSANLNARSMVGDSEFNICTEQYSFTQAARKRVWGNLAGADLDGKTCTREETKETFDKWGKRMKNNKTARDSGAPPENGSFIHPFEDPRGAPLVRLA